jgi:hypothetical protein
MFFSPPNAGVDFVTSTGMALDNPDEDDAFAESVGT